MTIENQVQIIDLPEMHFVGLYLTSPFKDHDPVRVEEMKREFNNRKGEIEHVIHPERYYCPSYSSEVLFTYLICMEVESLSNIPKGMIGFTIPPHRYAKVKSKEDPYQCIHDHLNRNGLHNDRRALALEIYPIDHPVWPDEAEVYIPLSEGQPEKGE
ncbi:GyrI-like domain-containing protein [Paenibacillus sp. URB8-2]|uniref:GyrI-like domain-containing protein n=1 Tax=Paenibacillus sp. URB8-2 TaxID=2741301 RepID=UPI0015C13D98|nr:effector binding domain-containing protein [Paenibacillus sp. URB8-2]BCG57396.1 hypothetical protein PUR_08210 [Paenibacillus sp. URB8-2]